MINTQAIDPSYIYFQYDMDVTCLDLNSMNNKLFCTFSSVCTYNIDHNNMSNGLLGNTILLHRKKESNTLYTINALNDLIKSLNGGVLDTSFTVNWKDYQNCILLTHSGDLKKLDTKIYKIITL